MYPRAGSLLIAAVLGASLTGCSLKGRQHVADEQLRAIYTNEWKWRIEQLPENEDGTLPIADRLPRVDPATQTMRLKYWQDSLRRVDAIPRESLSPKEQVNYDIYREQLAVLIARQRFRDFEMPANSDSAFWTDIGYSARRPFRTRDRAVDYLRQYTALPEHEIGTEVDRYLAWPAQALSYYLGERAMLDARARAETALGERFNVRAFHDAVLELGSVPLPVLQRRIDRFIVEGGRGPYPDME
ncbi:MAG TPA: DUF885 family protein [Steroidobacteraceae bacterium]